ncbi:uncharacterized protein LOC112570961 [Pomacea canaliculata]|uniref:uncharacterized protein LOC112570961 n=1 Tax=Pomacea canaliculata TaxID=400727 RepID=UPI000D728144|nr:uncharacterized protein LOC112570961 [Pomacea canaliculata]
MKYALGFCFFSAFVVGLVNSASCEEPCVDEWLRVAQTVKTATEICKNAQTYLYCLKSCGWDVTVKIQELQANLGSECDLSGSTSLSVSLLTALVGPLLAAYQTFGL